MSHLTDNHSKEDHIYIFLTKISGVLLVLTMITKKNSLVYKKINMASEIGETAFCTYITPEPH